MRNIFRERIAMLTDAEKAELIDNYVKLETEAQLGDEPLRRHAKAVIAELGLEYHNIVLCMQSLAVECMREFANRYRAEHGL